MSKTLDDYKRRTEDIVDRFNFNWSLYVQYIHLVEEVAELGEAITVKTGERQSGNGDKALADHSDLVEEVGDVLFSIIAVANKLEIDPSQSLEVAFGRYEEKLKKLNSSKQK